ncbi:MAG TPA: LuxR C-terminal-related transcriptional regulator [Thermoleophilaceae bacterium]
MSVESAAPARGWAALFWEAFARSKNAMALLDSQRVIVTVNQALEDAYGYEAEHLVGRRADVFLAPADWKRGDAEWNDVLKRAHAIHVRQVVRADGRHVNVQAAMLREEATGRQLVLFVALDEDVKPLRGASSAREGDLTPRELEIVDHVAMGRRAHEIADELFIATTTVETHVRNAMKKVGARSQAQLVAIVFARGLLDPAGADPEISG